MIVDLAEAERRFASLLTEPPPSPVDHEAEVAARAILGQLVHFEAFKLSAADALVAGLVGNCGANPNLRQHILPAADLLDLPDPTHLEQQLVDFLPVGAANRHHDLLGAQGLCRLLKRSQYVRPLV